MSERRPEKEGMTQVQNEWGFWHYVCPYCKKEVGGIEMHITQKHPELRNRCSKCGKIIKKGKT